MIQSIEYSRNCALLEIVIQKHLHCLIKIVVYPSQLDVQHVQTFWVNRHFGDLEYLNTISIDS